MKKIIYSLLWLCLLQIGYAQTTTQNFVRKTVPLTPVTTEAILNALSSTDKVENISYMDGLGRPIQNMLVKGSPGTKDIVQPIIYDKYGRQSTTLLPYTGNFNGNYDGSFYDNQTDFYSSATAVARAGYLYSSTVFDGSPLNNVAEQSAPDTDWKLGSGHTSKVETSYNQETDLILYWTIQTNGDISCTGYDDVYTSNQFRKTKYTDPNGNYSYVFTDKNGRTVCTRQFLELRGISQVPYYLTTYLIYDDFGQLVCVVPPKAMDLMDASGVYSVNGLTQDLVFRYAYDERHRLMEKKVPGTGWSYIVYNLLNQPVLFRDANLAAQNKWSFVKYDVLGRPVMSGLFDATGLSNYSTRALAQAQLNNPANMMGESEVPLDGSNPWGYTNVTLPNTALDILTVNYYDDYDFDNNGSADYSFNTTAVPCFTLPVGRGGGGGLTCLPYNNNVSGRTRGYLTGSRVKVLDAANPVQWEVAAVFYDQDGQAIQSQSNDHMGGADLINMIYDYTGNVIHTQQVHTLSGQSNIQVLNHLYYDKMGRLTQVDQKNNSDNAITLAAYNYNELSQVIEKNVHKITTTAAFLQSMDYRYNIHGMLTSINNIDLGSDMAANPLTGTNDDLNDLWGMQLNYNTNTTGVNGVKQYTGNVAEKKWRSVTDNIKRAYGYDYDKADRLKSSAYVEYNTGASLWNTNAGRYDEKDIAYDANGNITALKRYGFQAATSTFGVIDNLSYQYNGNFLGSVNDAVSTHGQLDFKDNGSTGTNEYSYDGNGNVTANPNKNITGITYNHLNLPTQITFSGTNKKIEYTYDASGTRLRKKVTNGAVITYKNYAGMFEYIDNSGATVLESMHTSEGRCIPTNSSGTLTFRYEYQYTDNTGNVVLAFSDIDANGSITPSTEVIQQSHYYAFGMRMEGTNVTQIGAENKYKFGGKEFNDELGLNEYDFGARFYDPAIARWGCLDPMADAAPNWTPFRYGFNNPITVTDPTGMAEVDWEGGFHEGIDDGKPKWVEKYDEKQGKIVGQWVYDSRDGSGTGSGTSGGGNSSGGSGSSGGSSSGSGSSDVVAIKSAMDGPQMSDEQINNSFSYAEKIFTSPGDQKTTTTTEKISTANGAMGVVQGHFENVVFQNKLGGALSRNTDKQIAFYQRMLYQPSGFAGPQVAKTTVTVGKVIKAAGWIGVGAGLLTDGYGLINHFQKKDPKTNFVVTPGKFGANLAMTTLGIIGGPPGWVISSVYFVNDATSLGDIISKPSTNGFRAAQDNTFVKPKFP